MCLQYACSNASHFVKNAHGVNFQIAYMRIPHNDKISPNLLHFAVVVVVVVVVVVISLLAEVSIW